MRCSLLFSTVSTVAFFSGCGADRPGLTESAAPPPAPVVARSQKDDRVGPPVRQASLLDALPEAEATGGQAAARIRATVNGAPIFEEEVQAASYQFLIQLRGLPEPEYSLKRREILKEALDQLVERELIIQDSHQKLKKAGPGTEKKLQDGANKEFDRRWVHAIKKNLGIKSDEGLRDFLRKQGLSLIEIRRQWVRQFLATEYLRSLVMHSVDRLGREQLVEYYEKHPGEFKVEDAVDWLDVFVSARNPKYQTREGARRFAEELARRARAGEDFVALCKANDDGTARLNEAKGDGRRRGEVRPAEAEEYLFRLPQGEVGPVVEIGSGFHVVKVVKRQYAGLRPFDAEVQKEIRNKLRNEVFTREAKKIVNDLRQKAVIEYAHGLR